MTRTTLSSGDPRVATPSARALSMAGLLAATATLAAGCGGGSSTPPETHEPAPATHASLDEPAWPPFPEPMPEDVSACVRDYRDIAATPFPARDESQGFTVWYAGPFQGWVDRYNAVRERCDAVFEDLDENGPHAQVMLAIQSYLHMRLGQEAVPHEEEPQMFVMSRYWTLGASCTYDRCAEGPLEAWANICRRQDQLLPACPPVPAPEGGDGAPAAEPPAETDPGAASEGDDE